MNEYEAVDDVVSEPGPVFPWPPAEGDSIVTAFSRTWTEASLRPRAFFAAMPADGIGSALLYYIPIGIAVAGATLLWSTVSASFPDDSVLRGLGDAAWSPVVEFLLSPLILLLSIFLAAGVTHALLVLLGAATQGYATTVRVFAFAYSPQILGVVPVVGQVAGFFWMVTIAIAGIAAAHRTSTARAATAILAPLLIMVVFLLIAGAAMLAMGGLVGVTPR